MFHNSCLWTRSFLIGRYVPLLSRFYDRIIKVNNSFEEWQVKCVYRKRRKLVIETAGKYDYQCNAGHSAFACIYAQDMRMRVPVSSRALCTLQNTIHYTGIRASFVQVAHVLRIINNGWQRRLRVPRVRPHDNPSLLLCRKTDDYRYDMWRGDFHARLTPCLWIFFPFLFVLFFMFFR